MILTDESGNQYEAVRLGHYTGTTWTLTLIPKEYRFGQIVLVETEEMRQAVKGEFYLNSDGDVFATDDRRTLPVHILKPIRIEE